MFTLLGRSNVFANTGLREANNVKTTEISIAVYQWYHVHPSGAVNLAFD